MDRRDAIVVGGGIAGAAAGAGLARRGLRVLLLERETVAGVHATGRNAAILRHGFGPPSDLALAWETRRVVREGLLGDIGLRACGSLHTAAGDDGRAALEREAERLRTAGLGADLVDPREAIRRAPLLEGAHFDAAVWTPHDAVLDIHALHQALLATIRDRGGEVELARAAVRILAEAGHVTGVAVNDDVARSDLVVDAAGPWSEEIAATAGGRRLGLRPCRRHLLQTEPDRDVDAAWPIVWDLSAGLYLRPESGGLLLSPCDEDELPPGDCREDFAVIERGIEKLVRHLPRLATFRILRSWAGLRTLTPDGACAVGFDPDVGGLFRVAGLGGHGISAAGGLMRLVPDLALDGGTDLLDAAEISPARFAR